MLWVKIKAEKMNFSVPPVLHNLIRAKLNADNRFKTKAVGVFFMNG